MLWQIVVVLLIIWLSIKRWKKRHMIQLYEQFKSNDMPLPFVGHAYLLLGNGEDRLAQFKKMGEESYKKGGLLAHWQGNRLYFSSALCEARIGHLFTNTNNSQVNLKKINNLAADFVVVVSDPVDAEAILKRFLEKDEVVKCSRALLGNGSIFAPVSIWRPRRKILAPTFSQKNLNNFVKIFAEQSSILVQQLKSAVGKGTFPIWKYFTTYTMDSVFETTLGLKIKSQLQPEQPFLKAFETICRLDAKRICQPWFYNDFVYSLISDYRIHCKNKKIIYDFIDEIVLSKTKYMDLNQNETKQENINGSKPAEDIKTFLDLLIESSNSHYNRLELREETLVLVLAGTDTSAVGASFVAKILARHQEVQEKCYKELQEVLGDSDRPVTASDLPRLKYLDAVIRETLRLYPPVPFIVRTVDDDFVLPSGTKLLKGCGIVVSILSIHRNPKYWNKADQFIPERFLFNENFHPAQFMPFSYGPRGCLGYQYAMMSMKTAIATLLRRYRIHTNSSDSIHKPIKLTFDIMMKDVEYFQLELELR